MIRLVVAETARDSDETPPGGYQQLGLCFKSEL